MKPEVAGRRRRRAEPLEIFLLVLLALVVLRLTAAPLTGSGAITTWLTVFTAVNVQAMPFVLLGVVVSGAVAAYVPGSLLVRALPQKPALAVPVAGVCGIALPGCECGSVPIADRLMQRGINPSAALAFMLSAPAINPVVLAATAVAFQTDTRMVWARLAAGLATALVVGLAWDRLGRPEWLRPKPRPAADSERPRWQTLVVTMRSDFIQSAGFLVIGAALVATLNVAMPRSWMSQVGSSLLLSCLLMGALAFAMSLCSQADAFVVAALTSVPMIGKLVFLTVGPAANLKLAAMQTGIFGRRFALRFVPLTLAVAIAVGAGIGLLFWGV